MSIDVARTKVEQLLNAVARAAASAGTPLQRLRGVALFDSSKDRFVTSLAEFEDARQALGSWEPVRARLGEVESLRLALQVVYGYFARTNSIEIDPAAFTSLWADLVAELESPVWLTRAVTNLRHFRCEAFPVELGDGLSIQGRSPEMLAEMGFHPDIWSRLEADWSGSGASSFVLLAETTSPKVPDNSISPDGPGVWLRCMRAIGAMRLIAPGDVGLSTTFFQRIAQFNVGIGGMHATGSTMRAFGGPYTWLPEHKGSYESVYAALAKLESIGYGRGPGNLDLALRAFMSSYDRVRMTNDERLVDAITALEAILGTESEIAFKLSFRVASLLAATDDERGSMLKTVKGFYDARSRIVHGGRLSKKHSEALASVDELRGMARQLLRAFVLLAADDSRGGNKKLFAEDLDAVLVNAPQREALRQSLGLGDAHPRANADSA